MVLRAIELLSKVSVKMQLILNLQKREEIIEILLPFIELKQT